MSRYCIDQLAMFEEVVVGWDEVPGGFFLQAFAKGDDPEEAPGIWLPLIRSLGELEAHLAHLGVVLPADVRADLVRDADIDETPLSDSDLAELLGNLPDDDWNEPVDLRSEAMVGQTRRPWFRRLGTKILEAIRKVAHQGFS